MLSQKVIELAGEAANGVQGPRRPHGRRADPGGGRSSARKFQKRFKYLPDHNGIKGYTAVYAVKYATEKKLGKFDRKALAKACTA